MIEKNQKISFRFGDKVIEINKKNSLDQQNYKK